MSEQNVVQQLDTSIPASIEPFFTGKDAEGQPITGADGQPIGGIIPAGLELFGIGGPGSTTFDQRYSESLPLMGGAGIAGMSDSQRQLGQQIAGLQAPSGFQTGAESIDQGIAGLLASPGRFTSDVAQSYMSPFQQNVTDIAIRKAIDNAEKTQLQQNLASARQGTYGGSRQALLQGAREAGLRQELSDLQTKGLQAAYENAQKMFDADRTAGIRSALGLGTLGAQAGALGVQDQAAELDRLKTLGAYGDLERGIDQQVLDAEKDLAMKRDTFEIDQLANLANLLRGVPLKSQTTTTTQPAPSISALLTQLGIGGLGLAQLMGGK